MMTNNEKQIINSFLMLEEISHEFGLETLRAIITLLIKAEKTTKENIRKWHKKFAVNGILSSNDVKQVLNNKELKEFKKLLNQYILESELNNLYINYIDELKDINNSNKITRLKTIEIIVLHNNYIVFNEIKSLIYGMIRKVYSDTYYRTIYEIQKYQNNWFRIKHIKEKVLCNLPFITISKDKLYTLDRIVKILNNHNKKINDIILKSVVYERAIDDTMLKIYNLYNKDKSMLGRIIRTEQAYYHSLAQQRAYNYEGVEEYQIIAIIDNRTSQICRFLNRKKFNIIEYEIGTTAPPFHPNCRSTTRPYIYRKNYNDLQSISFNEWKKRYVK